MIYQNFISPLDWSQSFIFTHIPKCAGTSVNIFLINTFGEDFKIFIGNSSNIYSEQENHFTRNLIGAGGHYPYGKNPLHFLKPDLKYFTVLRNPVERVISFYNYVISLDSHYLHTIFPNLRTLSIYDFLMLAMDDENEQIVFEVNDTIAKMLAPDANNAEDAIAFILKHYSIVGIQDRLDLFEKSIREFLLNFKCPQEPIGLINVAEDKANIAHSLDEKSYNLILEINKLDIEIYNYFSRAQF